MTVPMIKSIGDVPYPIDTHSDAFSPLLTAGAALGITGEATDSAAWLQRVSTSDGPATIRSIHGRTLRWNQRIDVTADAIAGNMGTRTFDSSTGIWSIACTNASTSAFGFYTIPSATRGVVGGHKSLVRAKVKLSTAADVRFGSASNYTTFAVGTDFTPIATVITPNTTVAASCYTNGGDGLTMQVKEIEVFDLTAMFGAGNEPSTVTEFEALFPLPYYEYDAGSLLSVKMTGVETTGFNQWDEQWELGSINDADGENATNSSRLRSKNYIPVFPDTDYYFRSDTALYTGWFSVKLYDASKSFISTLSPSANTVVHIPVGVQYIRFNTSDNWGGIPYTGGICINLSDPTRNGEYEPYWQQTRSIPAGTLRGAGTVYDELTETQAVTRVGEVTFDGSSDEAFNYESGYGGFRTRITGMGITASDPRTQLTSNRLEIANIRGVGDGTTNCIKVYSSPNDKDYLFVCVDGITEVAAFRTWLAANPLTVNYALAAPTVTPIDPPLNMTYRTEMGVTERVMVPTGENSAPPTLVTAQGYTAESLRDAALSAIAPVENGTASTNYAIGSYLVHGGQLCKVTTAIATGEAITIGTNVTATTVMAEVIALTQ